MDQEGLNEGYEEEEGNAWEATEEVMDCWSPIVIQTKLIIYVKQINNCFSRKKPIFYVKYPENYVNYRP